MDLISAFRLQLNPATPDVVAFVGAGGKTSTLFRLADEIVAAGKRVITTTTTRIFAEQMAQSPVHLPVTDGRVNWTELARILDQNGQCLLVTSIEGPKAMGIGTEIVQEVARRSQTLGIAAILNEADGSRRRPVKAPAPHEPVIPAVTTLLVPLMGLDGPGVPIVEPHVHRPEAMQRLLGVEPSTHFTPEMAARLLTHPAGGAKDRPAQARLLPLLNKGERAPRLATGRLIAHLLAQRNQASLIGTVGLPDRDAIRERWGSTAAVVLAAGGSSRMGEAKQLLAWAGEPLVVRAARLALESGANQTFVVTGAHGEEVQAALDPLRKEAGKRLQVVPNSHWAEGQSTSVQAAVRALPDSCEAALFLPVDQPHLPVTLLRRLFHLWRTGWDMAAPSVAGEVRGAPAVFDRSYWPDLLALTGDRGGRPLLKNRKTDVATIETPAHWLTDIDTPEAWAQMTDPQGQ